MPPVGESTLPASGASPRSSKFQLPSFRWIAASHFSPVATAISLAALPPYFCTSICFAPVLRPAVALSSFTSRFAPTSATSRAIVGSRSLMSSGVSTACSAMFSADTSSTRLSVCSSWSTSGTSTASKTGASSTGSPASPRMLKIFSRVSVGRATNVSTTAASTCTAIERPYTPSTRVHHPARGCSSVTGSTGAAGSPAAIGFAVGPGDAGFPFVFGIGGDDPTSAAGRAGRPLSSTALPPSVEDAGMGCPMRSDASRAIPGARTARRGNGGATGPTVDEYSPTLHRVPRLSSCSRSVRGESAGWSAPP